MDDRKIRKYVIAGGNRYIGFNKKTGKNTVVENFRYSVKLKYVMAAVILENLDAEVKGLEDWKIISAVEAVSPVPHGEPLDIDGMVDSCNVDFDLLIRRKKVLRLEYLEIEREITDLYHAMEFYDLSESDGFRLYKMMQEKLMERRKNKDEALKIHYVLSGGTKGLFNNQTKERIRKLNQRKYQPRAFKELFLAYGKPCK